MDRQGHLAYVACSEHRARMGRQVKMAPKVPLAGRVRWGWQVSRVRLGSLAYRAERAAVVSQD